MSHPTRVRELKLALGWVRHGLSHPTRVRELKIGNTRRPSWFWAADSEKEDKWLIQRKLALAS